MTNNADNAAAAVQQIRRVLDAICDLERQDHFLIPADIYVLGIDATVYLSELEDALAARDQRIAELEHKADQYDAVVEALHVCDGGQYRADTIESVLRAVQERDNYRNRAQIAELRAERASRESADSLLQTISGAIGLMNHSEQQEIVSRWWSAVLPELRTAGRLGGAK